jgi:tetratricopeptide (TPR) repeat protein
MESSGVFGRNHLTGLLWALEKLAWTKEYFQEAILALAELAIIDTGGNWGNRPINSITDILLPWHPQTLVDFSEKQIAVKSLMEDFESVAFEVLVSLLPNQSSSTSGTCKPDYLIEEVPEKISVTKREYFEEIDWYSNTLIDLLENRVELNSMFIKNMTSLTSSAYERYMKLLKSDKITNLNENERGKVWSQLLEFINHHSSYPDADWSLAKEKIEQLIDISEFIAPNDYLIKVKRLFTYDEFKLFSDTGDYDNQRKQLEKQRVEIISQILVTERFSGVVELCKIVESPFHVGLSYSAADISGHYYKELSKSLIDEIGISNQFIKGFLRGLDNQASLNNIDSLFMDLNDKDRILNILVNLPFTEESWHIAEKWLDDNYMEYWEKTEINYFSIKGEYVLAIEKLNEVKRYSDSVSLIYHLIMGKIDLDVELVESTVLKFAEYMNGKMKWDQHSICKIISYLQENSRNIDTLVTIEWIFIRLLDGRNYTPKPKNLSYQMSKEPEFFHQIIRMCYKSSFDDKIESVDEGLASNAWHALHSWFTIPGMSLEHEFIYEDFEKWFQDVRKLTEESGHYDVALQKIGEVLLFSPSDNSGLWIDKDIARKLNDRNFEHLRRGYRTAAFNSRGVHSVDTSGEADYKIAESYREKGDELKKYGYIRFADVMYGLQQTYIKEAESIIQDHMV